MYSSHGVWLIVTGAILLLAMVGTITMSLKIPHKKVSVNNNNLYTTNNSGKNAIQPINSTIR